MFTLRSPRKPPPRPIDTFSNTIASDFPSQAQQETDSELEAKITYKKFMESKRQQQTFLSRQLKQEIENKRRIFEIQHNDQNVQEQAESIINRFNNFRKPQRVDPIDVNINSKHVRIGEIKSIKDYMVESPRRVTFNKPVKSFIPEKSFMLHPMKTNFSKYVIPPPQVEVSGKKLPTTSEFVYPDGHFSAATTPLTGERILSM